MITDAELDSELRSHVDARDPDRSTASELVWARALGEVVQARRGEVGPARTRRARRKVALAAAGTVACTAAVAIAASGIGLPTSLIPASGPDPAGPGDPVSNGSSIGADGSIALVATGTRYRFVTIASSSAWGGTCYGIRLVGSSSPFSTIECPETSAAASSFLTDMTVWHVLGTAMWADPVYGFVGAGVDHVLIKTADHDYTLPVINGVYDYEGRLDGIRSMSAIAADGTVLQTATTAPFPWPRAS